YYQEPIDSDFSPYDAISLVNNYGQDWNTVKVFTQEFKFSSAANINSPFSWTAGLYLFDQKKPEKQGMYYGKDLGEDGDVTSILTNTSRSTGAAIFGQVGYELSSDFQIIAGLRYDDENQKQSGREERLFADKSIMLIQPDTSGTANFYAFTPS